MHEDVAEYLDNPRSRRNSLHINRLTRGTGASKGAPRQSATTSTGRSHWAIENSLHCVLDVSMEEDQTRNRKGNDAVRLGVIRRPALNIARMHPDKRSVRRNFARARRNDDILLDMIRRIRRREYAIACLEGHRTRSQSLGGRVGEVFGDAVVATAILDRPLHHSHVLTVAGESFPACEKALCQRTKRLGAAGGSDGRATMSGRQAV